MVSHQIYGLSHGSFSVVEPMKPTVEVDSTMAHKRDMFLVNSTLAH